MKDNEIDELISWADSFCGESKDWGHDGEPSPDTVNQMEDRVEDMAEALRHLRDKVKALKEDKRRQFESLVPQEILAEVFLHSNCETGEPLYVDILNLRGNVNLAWLYEALETMNNGPFSANFANDFYKAGAPLDEPAWFLCEMCVEEYDHPFDSEYYFEPIRRIDAIDAALQDGREQ